MSLKAPAGSSRREQKLFAHAHRPRHEEKNQTPQGLFPLEVYVVNTSFVGAAFLLSDKASKAAGRNISILKIVNSLVGGGDQGDVFIAAGLDMRLTESEGGSAMLARAINSFGSMDEHGRFPPLGGQRT